MTVSLALRDSFKVDIVRDRGALARIVAGGKTENVYRLQIMNATESRQTFNITANGIEGLQVVEKDDIIIESTQARWVAVRVQAPFEALKPGSHTIHFDIVAKETAAKVSEKSVFIVPR
jgi:polyferredoxin